MSACESKCDCGAPGGYAHDPDCHSWVKCSDDAEGGACDKHWEEALKDYAYLARVPRSAVYGEMTESEKQDLRDAGRGHLVDTSWLDRADAELDRLKEEGAL